MDRRNFLKRMGAGTAAAVVALKWKAPTRPPEQSWPPDKPDDGNLLLSSEPRQNFVAIHPEREPTWWARARIAGRDYRMSEVIGPAFERDILEDTVMGERIFKPGLSSATVEMELWAPDLESWEHLRNLQTGGGNFVTEFDVPGRIGMRAVGRMSQLVANSPREDAVLPTVRVAIELMENPLISYTAVEGG